MQAPSFFCPESLLDVLFYDNQLINNMTISDINACDTSVSPSGKCGGNAICSISPGGFSCACKPGFTGDPFVNCYGKFSTNIACINKYFYLYTIVHRFKKRFYNHIYR